MKDFILAIVLIIGTLVFGEIGSAIYHAAREKSKRLATMAREILKQGGHIRLYNDAMWINLFYGPYKYKVRKNWCTGKYRAITKPRIKNDISGVKWLESYSEFDTKEEAQRFIIDKIENMLNNRL